MIGRTLDRYTIESKLGEGGMGVVYRAVDAHLARPVALKILPHEHVADSARKLRFVQEAKAASALNHPGIVTIHDIRNDDGIDFIVMEYVEGQTLAAMIPPKGLPPARALRYGVAIADALAAAHQAGIIHRDLKPSNIMVTAGDRTKILDFGLAKLLTADAATSQTVTAAAPLTELGTVVGTAAYMSPEQGEGRELDARSDIFSFGSVLYEMVTGRRPFAGDSRLSVLAKILHEEPEPPSRLSGAVSPDLEKAILRCMRKDPARRYQTMADLKVALEDLASDSDAAASVTPGSHARGRLPALAGAAAAIVVFLAYVAWPDRRAVDDSAESPHAVPLTALTGIARSPSLSPDGNHVVFSWTGPRQDNPDIYVQQVGTGTPLRLTTDSLNDYSPSWSPDGQSVAFLRRSPSAGSEIVLVPPLGGPERKLAEVRPRTSIYSPIAVGWCPDSSCVVVTDSPGEEVPDVLFTINVATRERKALTQPQPVMMSDTDGAISPDGRFLAFRRETAPFTGALYLLPLRAGFVPAGEPRLVTDMASATKPAWMPDGREIIFAARRALWRVGISAGSEPARLPFVGQDGLTPTLARLRDGQIRLAYARSFADANFWRVDTDKAGGPAVSPPRLALSSTRFDGIPQLSPDGRRLAFLSDRSGQSEIWTADLDGANALQLSSLRANPGFPRWSPDGESIAFHCNLDGHGQIHVIPKAGGQARVLTSTPWTSAFPSYSRDGRWIYFASSQSGEEQIWKLPSGGGAAVQVARRAGVVAIETHDGRDLYVVDSLSQAGSLWRQPTAGGDPVKVLDGVVTGAFDVAQDGIYYIARPAAVAGGLFGDRAPGETRLQYFDFATRRITTVAPNLGAVGAGLSVSRDGRTIFYSRIDSSIDELMLVENFR